MSEQKLPLSSVTLNFLNKFHTRYGIARAEQSFMDEPPDLIERSSKYAAAAFAFSERFPFPSRAVGWLDHMRRAKIAIDPGLLNEAEQLRRRNHRRKNTPDSDRNKRRRRPEGDRGHAEPK